MKTYEKGQFGQKNQENTERNKQGPGNSTGYGQKQEQASSQQQGQGQWGQQKKDTGNQLGGQAKHPVQGQTDQTAQGKTPQSQQDAELKKRKEEERTTGSANEANKMNDENIGTGRVQEDDGDIRRDGDDIERGKMDSL